MTMTKRQTLLANLLLSTALRLAVVVEARHRIAIIGGGISGTFSARYLAEYDANHRRSAAGSASGQGGETTTTTRGCLLDEIVIYDVSPPPAEFSDDDDDESDAGAEADADANAKTRSTSDPRPPNYQGSRVSSITLNDGSVVELGASIIYEGNKLVVEMMDGDPAHLKKSRPMATGKKQKKEGSEDGGVLAKAKRAKNEPSGMGIYHGNKEWLLNTSFLSKYPNWLRKSVLEPLYFLWRYNLDYFRLDGAVKRAVQSFDLVYDLLNDTKHEVTYFQSPEDMWEAMGLRSSAGISFHDLLDGLGMYRDYALELESSGEVGNGRWDWRKWIPGMGCMRAELVSAIALNTYNQDLNQMNGLVGLVAYVPVGGRLFSVEGGNHRLMESALRQSRRIYDESACEQKRRIRRLRKKITAVVAGETSMELYADEESLGKFDVVILAAPLQQSRVQFLVESPMGLDGAVLHEMPLGGTVENLDSEDSPASNVATNEHGHHSFASSLPQSAIVPYTSVVTTVVSNATLNASHFGLPEDGPWPRSILVSEQGRALEGITTLTILSAEGGLMKTFSSEKLDEEKRNAIFGPHHVVEYVQVWGGGEDGGESTGGATPSFGGGRRSRPPPYLLYDGSAHWGKGDPRDGPALYYVNAVESAAAAIEMSAIGAKSTAKLAARRLGLIGPREDVAVRDEL